MSKIDSIVIDVIARNKRLNKILPKHARLPVTKSKVKKRVVRELKEQATIMLHKPK